MYKEDIGTGTAIGLGLVAAAEVKDCLAGAEEVIDPALEHDKACKATFVPKPLIIEPDQV